MESVSIRIEYTGGTANEGLLSAYEAGLSITGLSRALALSAHALVGDGRTRLRARRTPAFHIYIAPPRGGSFIEELRVVFSDPIVQVLGGGVIGNALWDLIKVSWSATVDKLAEPETDHVKALLERQEPVMGRLPYALESPLEQVHRPIQRDREIEISVQDAEQRIEVVRFDDDTLEAISSNVRDKEATLIHGNVTRYNILTGFGRLYALEEGRVVPFRLGPSFPEIQKAILTWSMDDKQRGGEGLVTLRVFRVASARGVTKRYLVEAAQN